MKDNKVHMCKLLVPVSNVKASSIILKNARMLTCCGLLDIRLQLSIFVEAI